MSINFIHKKGTIMLKRYLPEQTPAMWLVSLLLISLTLAACGGATEPVSQEPTTAVETEEAVDSSAGVEEAATEEPPATPTEVAVVPEETEESAPVGETETVQDTDTSATLAECQSVDIPDNGLIAAVSESDWARGPANAPVTLIEYGDYQ
jgi:hypothetical protein